MKTKLPQQVKPLISLTPTSHSGTTAQAGAIIDRRDFDSAIFIVNAAAASGSPDAGTLTISLEHGNDSGLSDTAAVTLNATPATVDCDAGELVAYHFLLRGMKRYIRFTTTPAFTGGSSPASVASACIILGDADTEPQPSAVTVFSKA